MTIREFITEADAWQYSQEYFDLLVECNEVELLERYIENSYYQLYGESTLDDEFFTEAADEEKTEELEDKAANKSEGILKQLWNKLCAAASSIASFVMKIFDRAGRLDEKAETVASNLNNVEMSEELANNLITLYKEGLTKSFGEGVGDPSHRLNTDGIRELIGFVLVGGKGSNFDKIYKQSFKVDSGNYQYAKEIDSVCDTLEEINDKCTSQSDITRINGKITSVGNGLPVLDIKVSASYTKVAVKKLKELQKKWKKEVKISEAQGNTNGAYLEMIKNALLMCSSTIKLYTDYQKFREYIVKGVGSLVGGGKSSKTRDIEDDNEAEEADEGSEETTGTEDSQRSGKGGKLTKQEKNAINAVNNAKNAVNNAKDALETARNKLEKKNNKGNQAKVDKAEATLANAEESLAAAEENLAKVRANSR